MGLGGFGTSMDKSELTGGCSCGGPATESALCIAAADGTVGICDALVRVGLMSVVLFFRDLNPLEPSEVPGFSGGRMGEASQEGFGELNVEDGFEKRGVVDARLSGGGEADDC